MWATILNSLHDPEFGRTWGRIQGFMDNMFCIATEPGPEGPLLRHSVFTDIPLPAAERISDVHQLINAGHFEALHLLFSACFHKIAADQARALQAVVTRGDTYLLGEYSMRWIVFSTCARSLDAAFSHVNLLLKSHLASLNHKDVAAGGTAAPASASSLGPSDPGRAGHPPPSQQHAHLLAKYRALSASPRSRLSLLELALHSWSRKVIHPMCLEENGPLIRALLNCLRQLREEAGSFTTAGASTHAGVSPQPGSSALNLIAIIVRSLQFVERRLFSAQNAGGELEDSSKLGDNPRSVFRNCFVEPFLRQTASYYSSKSTEMLRQCELSGARPGMSAGTLPFGRYVETVEACLEFEAKNAEVFLDTFALARLLAQVRQSLVGDHLRLFSSEAEALIRQNATTELSKIYHLVSFVPEGLTSFQTTLQAHITQEARAIEPGNTAKTTFSYVLDMCRLLLSHRSRVRILFDDEPLFTASIDKAFREVLNDPEHHLIPFYRQLAFAMHLIAFSFAGWELSSIAPRGMMLSLKLTEDCHLGRFQPREDNDAIQNVQAATTLLFKFLSNKSHFRQCYIGYLNHRLMFLHNVLSFFRADKLLRNPLPDMERVLALWNAQMAFESRYLNILGLLCGRNYIYPMRRMLGDAGQSFTLNKQMLSLRGAAAYQPRDGQPPPPVLHVLVCNRFFWPMVPGRANSSIAPSTTGVSDTFGFPLTPSIQARSGLSPGPLDGPRPTTLQLPAELLGVVLHFETEYVSRFPGRRLTWLHDAGRACLRMTSPRLPAPVEVYATAHQALILRLLTIWGPASVGHFMEHAGLQDPLQFLLQVGPLCQAGLILLQGPPPQQADVCLWDLGPDLVLDLNPAYHPTEEDIAFFPMRRATLEDPAYRGNGFLFADTPASGVANMQAAPAGSRLHTQGADPTAGYLPAPAAPALELNINLLASLAGLEEVSELDLQMGATVDSEAGRSMSMEDDLSTLPSGGSGSASSEGADHSSVSFRPMSTVSSTASSGASSGSGTAPGPGAVDQLSLASTLARAAAAAAATASGAGQATGSPSRPFPGPNASPPGAASAPPAPAAHSAATSPAPGQLPGASAGAMATTAPPLVNGSRGWRRQFYQATAVRIMKITRQVPSVAALRDMIANWQQLKFPQIRPPTKDEVASVVDYLVDLDYVTRTPDGQLAYLP
ncbi:hypothetical protein, variant [Fonticula alba]|uniref:Cullin family profile domain-containing protein n=1 Tax=Fonticula alba TaxID=691883 RepID=A0A058ZG88_FONAL|nr:hypothetical protein, variant [Fonticula alba]KCV72948.1 hypothetical protein, variant [Fonticula alba]|eukprot:XP_009492649.1 hypothetical protein, variant [Fonticula alba]